MTLKQLRPSADKTRQSILAAATQLFAKKGFSGTSISDISKQAKVNPSLIYHHFGSKEQLWNAVKTEVCRNYIPVNCENCSLKSFLRYVIVNRTEFFNTHPELLRIAHWQVLEPHSIKHTNIFKLLADEWLYHIKRLQRDGEIRHTLDPHLIITLILAVCDGAHREMPAELATVEPEKQTVYLNMAIDGLYRMLSPSTIEED